MNASSSKPIDSRLKMPDLNDNDLPQQDESVIIQNPT